MRFYFTTGGWHSSSPIHTDYITIKLYKFLTPNIFRSITWNKYLILISTKRDLGNQGQPYQVRICDADLAILCAWALTLVGLWVVLLFVSARTVV